MDVTIQAYLEQWSPELRRAVASIVRYTQDLSPEARRLVICYLEGTNPCAHPNATRTCTGCHQPRASGCCKIRDPAIQVQCPDCDLDTLA